MTTTFVAAGMGAALLVVFALARSLKEDQLREEQAERRRQEERDAEDAAVLLYDLALPALEHHYWAEKHLGQFEGIATFDEVAAWDARALEIAGEIEDALSRAQADMASAEKAIAESVDGGLVASACRRKTAEAVSEARNRCIKLVAAYEQLMERVDLTPDDETEQKALLKDLRAAKKDLQMQKRVVKAEAKEIRAAARFASANAGATWAGYNSRLAAEERRRIRANKEAILQPHEDEVAALDRQILAIDRRIEWVKRIS